MVEILDETQRFPSTDALESLLERLMIALDARHPGLAERDVTVVLVDDARIRALNREHRDVDDATDVLSYPLHEPDDSGFPTVPLLGDVVISVETAQRQAARPGAEAGNDEATFEEVAVLAAHGLVHLLGYDHETEEEWQTFRDAQRTVLEIRRNGSEGSGRR